MMPESLPGTDPTGKQAVPTSPPSTPHAASEAQPSPRSRRLWPGILLILAMATSGLLWWRQEQIGDWFLLQGYHPSAVVAQLAGQATMTGQAKRLFYVNHPAVEDKVAFNQHCPNASHEVAVLGCYLGNRQGISVYHVTDERLEGIEQVTTAHEMLHQAYDRLSGPEKQRINAELEAYAQTITDKALQQKLAAYKKIEPNDLPNEMHSIFGSEVANLPPGLENYYKRYFVNRSQLVAYHARYQAAFTERQRQIEAYDAQITALSGRITALKATLKATESDLQRQYSRMESWLHSGKIEQYNAAVSSYNANVAAYEQAVSDVNSLIQQYNTLIDKRNAIAVEEQELLKAQDSHASSAGTQ